MNELIHLGIDGDLQGGPWRSVMRHRLEQRAGLPKFESAPLPQLMQSQRLRKYEARVLEVLGKSEQFDALDMAIVRPFMQEARNRLVMGALRYGQIGDESKPKYDRFASIYRRMMVNFREPNMEHLVDIFNEAGLEYEEPFGSRFPFENEGEYVIRFDTNDILSLDEKKDVFASLMSFMHRHMIDGQPDHLVGIGCIVLSEYLFRYMRGQRIEAQDDGPIHTS